MFRILFIILEYSRCLQSQYFISVCISFPDLFCLALGELLQFQVVCISSGKIALIILLKYFCIPFSLFSLSTISIWMNVKPPKLMIPVSYCFLHITPLNLCFWFYICKFSSIFFSLIFLLRILFQHLTFLISKKPFIVSFLFL